MEMVDKVFNEVASLNDNDLAKLARQTQALVWFNWAVKHGASNNLDGFQLVEVLLPYLPSFPTNKGGQ